MEARRRTAIAGAGMVAAAVALTACGGGGSSSAQKSSGSSSGPSGSPIKVMNILSKTGTGYTVTGVSEAAQVAVDAVNAAGGLNGHPLRLIVCDDGGDPNKDAQCGRQAVSEHVLAVVGAATDFGTGYVPIIQKAGIPTVGNFAVSSADLTSPISFPLESTVTEGQGIIALNAAAGAKKQVMVVPDVAGLDLIVNTDKKEASVVDADITAIQRVSPNATDLTAAAAQAVSDPGRGVFFGISKSQGELMAQAWHQSGVDLQKQIVTTTTTTITPEFASKHPDVTNGMYISTALFPPTATSNSGVALYNSEFQKYAHKSPISNTDTAVEAWASVHILANIAKGMTDLTPANLVDKLNSAGPIDFAPFVPFDWSKPLYPDVAPRGAFTKFVVFARIIDGQIKAIVQQPVDITKPYKLNGASG